MKIQLKNVGMIQDSSILLEGLTVVTGDNQSGKTTVGKALYGVCRGLWDLEENYRKDRFEDVWEKVKDMRKKSTITREFFRSSPDSSLAHFLPFSTYSSFFNRQSLKLSVNSQEEEEEMIEFLESLLKDLPEVKSFLQENQGNFSHQDGTERLHFMGDYLLQMLEELDFLQENTQKLIQKMKSPPNYQRYGEKRVETSLSLEFHKQITRLQSSQGGAILISEQEQEILSLLVEKEQVSFPEKKQDLGFFQNQDIYFLDMPFLMDRFSPLSPGTPLTYEEKYDTKIQFHQEELLKALNQVVYFSVYQQLEEEEQGKEMENLLHTVLSGDFSANQRGVFYQENGVDVRVENLATGSKLFSILKILMGKRLLKQGTILILDEPEAHLHPKWQNIFAELVVLMVKTMDIRVLLTSHSAQFVLAVDASMRKHKIEEKSHFYQTKLEGENTASYHCVDEDLGLIYGDFTKYLSRMKALRDEYTEY